MGLIFLCVFDIQCIDYKYITEHETVYQYAMEPTPKIRFIRKYGNLAVAGGCNPWDNPCPDPDHAV